ncbi:MULTISPECIES: hypothetical protein [unclassified Rathayibacter]|uniref:hypothetical protein n=1 Tax=unclassified Rathayibacter TaxID=2609250 RepID=UPI0006F2991D|nr:MULTISPECIES: hypothetical protein [unclassified Rathayibacter]KQQ04127.1 hypothetical protein ASF42_12015 [Rathayibacter sp. Leaf294]KQS12581.1 hypothetical protein ASG06_12015 [Rathayibacter sp. Leaf185]
MVRRGDTAEPAIRSGSRRSRLRPDSGARRRLLGSAAASVITVAVLALGLGVLAPLAGLPATVADAPRQCGDARELLDAGSVLDSGSVAVAGHLIACVDEGHRRLTIHNRTPIVWALSDPSVRGVVSQTGGVTGLLSSHASRAGLGLILAPGASAAISAGPGRLTPQPDVDGTRLFLALSAVVEAQDLAESDGPPRAPRSVVRTAALTCALALVERSEGWAVTSSAEAAMDDGGCARAWRGAQVTALSDGWLLPSLAEALARPERQEADAATSRAAADWFAASSAFSWGGVDRPERLT